MTTEVVVQLVSDAGYVFAYTIGAVGLERWLETAQEVCPDMGIILLSKEEADRTYDEDFKRNARIMGHLG